MPGWRSKANIAVENVTLDSAHLRPVGFNGMTRNYVMIKPAL